MYTVYDKLSIRCWVFLIDYRVLFFLHQTVQLHPVVTTHSDLLQNTRSIHGKGLGDVQQMITRTSYDTC